MKRKIYSVSNIDPLKKNTLYILEHLQKSKAFFIYFKIKMCKINKITRSVTLFFLTKNKMFLFCLTIYSTLLAKSNHQSDDHYHHLYLASKVQCKLGQNFNIIFLSTKIMFRLPVILFVTELYAQTNISNL